MRYLLRIAAVVSGVVIASAVLAVVINHFLVLYGVVSDADGVATFVGLVTSGILAAMLTRESWLAAQ
ncbi:MAG: hypothetical protein IT193_06835 [Propionibacteriaceae bacterium]|nr:hypothetical protein [Propionibacteriaceae bacterium]